MSKVVVHLGARLDGVVAGTDRGPTNPLGPSASRCTSGCSASGRSAARLRRKREVTQARVRHVGGVLEPPAQRSVRTHPRR
jgi:hypothetical protein